MAPNAEETCRRLIAAAEGLFAERGIDGVSLREINVAAGQRNTTALQYHFGDRTGLLKAVLARHRPGIEEHRHRLLDSCDSLRDLSAALVRPEAAKLADPDGGRDYLRIVEQLVQRGRPDADPGHSVNRWRELAAQRLPEVAVRLHQRFMAIRVTYVELARRASAAPAKDDRLFTSHLIDVVSAVLTAEVSEETAALLRERHS